MADLWEIEYIPNRLLCTFSTLYPVVANVDPWSLSKLLNRAQASSNIPPLDYL